MSGLWLALASLAAILVDGWPVALALAILLVAGWWSARR